MDIEMTGHRWQKACADLMRQLKPDLIVETGVSEGVSTRLILEALDDIKHGALISVDPFTNYTNPSRRWKHVKELSCDALPKIYLDYGPFDVFIHDADHEIEGMSIDLEFAWHFVKPGGRILSDDITWGNHGAWPAFIARHGVKAHGMMGYAGWAVKPLDSLSPVLFAEDMPLLMRDVAKLAHAAATARGEKLKYLLEL